MLRQIRVKRLVPEAKLPFKAHDNDACYDLFCVQDEDFLLLSKSLGLLPGESHLFHTGIALEIPPGFCLELWDRSSMGIRDVHRLAGMIDANYRGEIMVQLINLGCNIQIIKAGDKIIQAKLTRVYPAEIVEVDKLSGSERGENGFGSTGR